MYSSESRHCTFLQLCRAQPVKGPIAHRARPAVACKLPREGSVLVKKTVETQYKGGFLPGRGFGRRLGR